MVTTPNLPSLRRRVTVTLLLLGALTHAACDWEGRSDDDAPRASVDFPQPAFPDVPDSIIMAGAGSEWPAPGGGLFNHSFSTLDQIRPGNVHHLVPVWLYSTGIEGAMETSPVVVGNTMYVTSAGGRVIALNAATGDELWTYDPAPQRVTLCCGPINRGVSVWSTYVYVSRLDARLTALDARSGRPVWEAELGDPEAGYSAIMAPLAVDGRVFVGVTGEKYGARGFMAAFDGRTGEELWRWNTVPSPDDGGWWGGLRASDPFGTPLNRDLGREREEIEARGETWRLGGGGITTTPAYDPETARIFINVEGPAPLLDPSARPGDNLYTGSIVALDARTGNRVWHAQYLPHDAWGLSGGSPPFLFDRGGDRYVAFAGRTGWVYVFRASDGAPILRSDNFVPQEGLFSRIQPDQGPIRVAPGLNGGNAGSPVSYDARSGVVFVGGVHQPMVYSSETQSYSPGELWLGGVARFPPGEDQWGTVTAIDLGNGEIRWQRRTPAPVHSGVLGTAGNLVFVGQGSGTVDAFRADNGELLWQFNMGSGVHGAPVTYSVGGVQFIVVAAGGSLHFDTRPGDDIIAFALADRRPPMGVRSYPTTDYARHGPASPQQGGGVRQQTGSPVPALPPETPEPQPPAVDSPAPDG
jgi:alcohol dehydrogenase (cytochrome c)